MRDTAQLDLFDPITIAHLCKIAGDYAEPVPGMRVPPTLPSRSDEWDRHIAGCAALARTRIHVSPHWTGVVLERLIDFERGHWLLWSNGTFVEYGPRPRPDWAKPLRLIHMAAEGVRALHRWAPLVQDWYEPNYAWFRFAEGGETPAAELRVPTG